MRPQRHVPFPESQSPSAPSVGPRSSSAHLTHLDDALGETATIRARAHEQNPSGYRHPLDQPYKSPDPAVESFFERTTRETKKTSWEKVLNDFKTGVKEFFIPRHALKGQEFLWKVGNRLVNRTEGYAVADDLLRQGTGARRNAMEVARLSLGDILDDLAGPNELDVVMRYSVMKGLDEDIVRFSKENPDVSGRIPLGLTPEKIGAEARNLENVIRSNPALSRAYAAKQRLTHAIKAELQDRGILGDDAREHYFPHRIIDKFIEDAYGEAIARSNVPRGKGIRTPITSSMKKREGSARDFSTDFLTVMGNYIAEMVEGVQKWDIALQIGKHYDVRNMPMIHAEKWMGQGDSPPGYTRYNLRTGFERLFTGSIQERLLSESVDNVVGELAKVTNLPEGEISRMMHHIKRTPMSSVGEHEVIIPIELANELETWARTKGDILSDKLLGKAVQKFKSVVIHKAPIQYNVRNMLGDLQRAYAQFGNEIFHSEDWKASLDDVLKVLKGEVPSDFYRTMQKMVVPSSGRMAVEARDLVKVKEFVRFLDKNNQKLTPARVVEAWQKYLGPRMASAREDLVRLVVARMNVRRHAAGKEMLRGVVDADEVRGLLDFEAGDPHRAAARIARKSLIDYGGDFTASENKLRNGALPFYSWVKGNLKFWGYDLPKAVSSGGVSGGDASRVAAVKGVATVLTVMAAARVWNSYVMGDAEDKLPEHMQRGNHLILAEVGEDGKPKPLMVKDKDGKDRVATIAIPDAMDDFMQWSGLETVAPDALAAVRGKISWNEVLDRFKENAPLAPVRSALSQLGPGYNILDALGGQKSFPDPLNPQKVPEEQYWRNVASSLGFSVPNKPSAQLGYKPTAPTVYDGFRENITREISKLENDLNEIDQRQAGYTGGLRMPQKDQASRNKEISRLESLRLAKIRRLDRLAKRLSDIDRRAKVLEEGGTP